MLFDNFPFIIWIVYWSLYYANSIGVKRTKYYERCSDSIWFSFLVCIKHLARLSIYNRTGKNDTGVEQIYQIMAEPFSSTSIVAPDNPGYSVKENSTVDRTLAIESFTCQRQILNYSVFLCSDLFYTNVTLFALFTVHWETLQHVLEIEFLNFHSFTTQYRRIIEF